MFCYIVHVLLSMVVQSILVPPVREAVQHFEISTLTEPLTLSGLSFGTFVELSGSKQSSNVMLMLSEEEEEYSKKSECGFIALGTTPAQKASLAENTPHLDQIAVSLCEGRLQIGRASSKLLADVSFTAAPQLS